GSSVALAKLDLASGNLDTVFSPLAANGFLFSGIGTSLGTVYALTASGTSLYVGGDFNSYRGVAGNANALAKLDLTSGAIAPTFSPATNGFPTSLASQVVSALAVSGSSLYVGGNFSNYRSGTGNANGIAKLDLSSGALDTTFSPPTTNGFDFPGTVT